MKTKSFICTDHRAIKLCNGGYSTETSMQKFTTKSRINNTKREFILSNEGYCDDNTNNSSSYIENLLDLDQDCSVLRTNDALYDVFLAQTLNIISLSPTGNALVQEASEQGWRIEFDDLSGENFMIDIGRRIIALENHGLRTEGLIRSTYFANLVLISLVKALRDVWHEKRQNGSDHLFAPEGLLMLERVRSADCDIISVLVAWELRSEGYTDIWRHMIGSANGDLAVAYSYHLERDPASQFNGKALKSAFVLWFQSPDRVRTCDHQSLEYMDDILADSEEKNPFGEKMPTHIAIELLSCLPDKTAYLQGFGREILIDPQYSGLSDPLNQAHLMHILHDLEATIINNVPFRNSDLAARIFPQQSGVYENF